MPKKKTKRRRATREDVRKNAEQSGKGGGISWFNLPEGVEVWYPKVPENVTRPDKHKIDIVPYEVKTKNHPDRVEKGLLWYKYPFKIHFGVGVQNEAIVCPTTIGKPCPICEERERLRSQDADKDMIKSLYPKAQVAYNILHPDDPDKIAIFAMSFYKFAKKLDAELQDPDNEENLLFYETTKDGRTIIARFKKEPFMDGKSFAEVDKIVFKKRGELDEDDILEKALCLDDIFNILPYEKIKDLFFGIEENDDDEDEEEEETTKKKKSSKKSKPEPEEEDEDEEFDDDDEDTEDEGEDEDDVEDEGEDEDDVEDEEDPDEDDDEDDAEDEEFEDDDEDTEDEGEDEDDVEDDDEEEEPPKKKSSKKSKQKEKPKAKAKEKKSKHKCPAGGVFGKDLDKHKKCKTCKIWDECEEESEG